MDWWVILTCGHHIIIMITAYIRNFLLVRRHTTTTNEIRRRSRKKRTTTTTQNKSLTRFWHNLNGGTVIQSECQHKKRIFRLTNRQFVILRLAHTRKIYTTDIFLILAVPVTWFQWNFVFTFTWINYEFEYPATPCVYPRVNRILCILYVYIFLNLYILSVADASYAMPWEAALIFCKAGSTNDYVHLLFFLSSLHFTDIPIYSFLIERKNRSEIDERWKKN